MYGMFKAAYVMVKEARTFTAEEWARFDSQGKASLLRQWKEKQRYGKVAPLYEGQFPARGGKARQQAKPAVRAVQPSPAVPKAPDLGGMTDQERQQYYTSQPMHTREEWSGMQARQKLDQQRLKSDMEGVVSSPNATLEEKRKANQVAGTISPMTAQQEKALRQQAAPYDRRQAEWNATRQGIQGSGQYAAARPQQPTQVVRR